MFQHSRLPRLLPSSWSSASAGYHVALRVAPINITACGATDATSPARNVSSRRHQVHSSSLPTPGTPTPPTPSAATPTPTGVRLTAHTQYHAVRLSRDALPADPLELFRSWLRDAISGSVREPEAMTLCTSTPEGIPSARAVLLKEVDDRGFVFFTNYDSRKGRELTVNPNAALAMHWREQARQVRVVGPVEKVTRAESEAYFATRPRGSQIGAWASQQSKPVEDGELEAAVAEAQGRFDGVESVPCPPNWGGYRVIPTEIEFWAGQPSRLHDRFVYLRDGSGPWRVERRAP